MFAGAAIMLASTYASPVAAQALEELLKQTIEPHDRVAAAQAEVEAQRNKAREALGDWFPTLTPTGTYGWEKQNKPGSIANTSTGFGEFDLKVSQLLWDFGATNAAVEKARLQLLEAEVKLVSARQDLMLEAVTAYVNLLRAHQVLAYAKQSEENIRKQTGLEEARVESGAGLSTDVLQAKTQLAGAEARRIQAAGGLVSATNRFRAVFGREPGGASNLVPVSVSEAVLPIDLNSAIGIAQDNNAQLILANLTEAIAREDVNATKSKEFFPKVEGALEQKWKRNVAGTLDNQIETVAKVEVSIPFNLGFTGVNKLRAAQSTLIARTRTVADTRRRVEEQVRNAWDQLRTAKDTAASRRTQASIAEAFLDLARKERQLGQRSLIDVLSGETSLINAQSDAVSAETDVLVAAFGLIKEIGRLGYDSFRPAAGGSGKGPDGDDAAATEPPRPRGDAKAQAQALTRRLSLTGTAYETFTPMTPRKPAGLPPKAKWTQPPPEASVAPLAPPEPKSAPTTAVTVDTAPTAADLTLPPGGLAAPAEALPIDARPAGREKTDRPTPARPTMPPKAAVVPSPDGARTEATRSAKVVSLPIDPAPATKPPSGSGRAKYTKPPDTQRPADERNFLARIFSGANKPHIPVATAEIAPPPKAASTEVAERTPQPDSTTPDRSFGFKPLTKDQDFFVWLFSHAQGSDENAARSATPAPSPPPATTADRQDPPVSAMAAAKPPSPAQLKDEPSPTKPDRSAQAARSAPPTEPAPRSTTADNPVVALVGGFFGALASLFTGEAPKAQQFDVPPPAAKPAAVKVAAAPAPPAVPQPATPAEPKALTKDQDFFVWLFSHARMPAAEGTPDATPEPASTGGADDDLHTPALTPIAVAAKPQAPTESKATAPQPQPVPSAPKEASATGAGPDNPIVTLVSGFFGALASLFTGDLPATQVSSTPAAATPPPSPREPRAEPPAAIAERTPVPAAKTKSNDPLLGGLVAFIANNRVFEPTPAPPKP